MARASEKLSRAAMLEMLAKEMTFKVKASRSLGRPEDRQAGKSTGFTPYRPGVKLCLERARLVTEAYKETEGEPMALRRAKAMAKFLDKMTIWIGEHDFIVGNFASDPDSLSTIPELWWHWLDREIEKDYKMLLEDAKDRQELHDIHKYWPNFAVHGMERKLLPEEILPYWSYTNQGALRWTHGGRAGIVPNYEKLFKVGLNGIIKEAEEELKKIAKDPGSYLLAREYLEKKYFLEAAIISMKAAIRWGKRYADKAREMAALEKDEGRKKELEEIANVCDWVPGNPPRGLHDAIQCYFFTTLITRVIDLQSPGLGDRFDQILYPFYAKDKEAGRITREEAQELVEFLYIKMNEFGEMTPPVQGATTGAVNTARVFTVGGVDADGDDATNEMSYIALDAKNAVGLTQPAIAIRIHNRTPQEFLYKVTESLRKISGVYSFFNDNFYIPYLTNLGIPLRDARNYGIEGCMRWVIPGKAMAHRAIGGNIVLAKCLEYALSQGVDKFSGKRMGYPTPDPRNFTSFEDVVEAYLTQVKFFTEKLVAINNLVDVLDEQYLPQPFVSALLDGCIEHGQDCRKYRWFPKTLIQPVGHITVSNSFAVIKKLVFDDKVVSISDLAEAVNNNWEGREELRQMCIHRVPKFGNDDDYVDLIARDIVQRTTDLMQSFPNLYGGRFLCDGTGGASYFAYTGLTGATPDGRKDREAINDGTISPAIGTDKKGPSAVLASVGKIDHIGTFNNLFNQKFLPVFLTDKYRDSFIGYLRTWANLNIHHVQFNVVNKETLLEAQQHPDKYAGLVVRVAGFSAYFIDLQREVQDQIIARTEQFFTK